VFAAILNQITSHHPGLSKDLIAVAVTSHVGTGPPQRIKELLRKTAEELPILRQSCRGIIDCTDDDTSSANDVSEIIKHDQALLAKVIKLANSATYYAPQPVVSSFQAVKIIGFDVIRAAAISAEFVERTDERGGDSAVLKKLLARAVVSATAAQELEEACKFPKNPNLFTCTMLYTLGDLVLAHFLPDIYRILEAAQCHEPERVHTLETELLGQTFQGLAAKMAKKLGLPSNITTLIETKPNLSKQQWTTTQDRLTGLVCAANELGNCLLSPPTPCVQASLQELLARFPQALNISPQDLKTITIKAFLKADQLSVIMKIEKKYFVPNSDWEILDKAANPIKDFIGGIWHATNTYQGVNPNAKTVSST
jgi:HD-like signal output (HDOD) protein